MFLKSAVSPKSDQHQVSHHIIKSMHNEEKRLYTKGSPNALIFYQILSTYSLGKCTEISMGNLHVDI